MLAGSAAMAAPVGVVAVSCARMASCSSMGIGNKLLRFLRKWAFCSALRCCRRRLALYANVSNVISHSTSVRHLASGWFRGSDFFRPAIRLGLAIRQRGNLAAYIGQPLQIDLCGDDTGLVGRLGQHGAPGIYNHAAAIGHALRRM